MNDGSASSTNVIDVAAGLVFHNGKLLITQRPTNGHLPNLWEFPGGKREPGETFEECLHRELKEELEIAVEIRNVVESIVHEYPEKTVRLKFFDCRLASGEPRAIECQDFNWVTRVELGDFEFPAADKKLIESLRSDTGFWEV